MQKQHRIAHQLAFALALALPLTAPAQDAATTAAYRAAIANPARDADRKDDAHRKVEEFLQFAEVRPGMKVLDLMAGSGSTAELLALVVGPQGEVWAQNGKESAKLKARLAAHAQPNLHPLVVSLDKPVAAGMPPLDLITINMSYHDIVAETPTDRAAMNKALFAALKPGGKLVIVDNSAKAGTGLSAAKTLHRIDEAAVIDEVTRAGFVLDAKSDYLRAPSDPREQPFWEMKGQPDDKFALRFRKP